MATKYSRRQFDGTIEYYDTREEMEAANPTSTIPEIIVGVAKGFNPIFAFWGFLLGGVAAFLLLHHMTELVKWQKFISVVGVAVCSSYFFGRLGNVLFMLFIAAVAIGMVYGIGMFAWHFI